MIVIERVMQCGSVNYRSKGDGFVGQTKEFGKLPLNESPSMAKMVVASPALTILSEATQSKVSTSARDAG